MIVHSISVHQHRLFGLLGYARLMAPSSGSPPLSLAADSAEQQQETSVVMFHAREKMTDSFIFSVALAEI